jgi:ribosomal protein S18 acetylase RimI-like enzyme
VNVCDWRDAAPDTVAPLYRHGRERWLRELGWETSGAWQQIEQARTTWGLPGLLAVDDGGQVRGWSYFHLQDTILHVGGLIADTPLATRALVGTLAGLARAEGIDGLSCFVFEEAPEIYAELERRGFAPEHFIYLARDLQPSMQAPAVPHADGWTDGDLTGAAALLRAAYDADDAKYFAPGHTAAAWERYVRSVVDQTGLGSFNPAATRLVRNGDRLDAAVLMTALSADTAHIAQVAVHPSRRREGLAAALVEGACHRAAQSGCRQATLLVGASNRPARRLYGALGFYPRAAFVAASI